jgi:hypothetical protein
MWETPSSFVVRPSAALILTVLALKLAWTGAASTRVSGLMLVVQMRSAELRMAKLFAFVRLVLLATLLWSVAKV